MKYTAKLTAAVAFRSVVALAAGVVLAGGCQADEGRADGDRPGVIAPQRGSSPVNASARKTGDAPSAASESTRPIATIQGIDVPAGQLNALLYASTGLDALLKLVQLNMAKAEVQRLSLSVSPADVANERKLTMQLAFPSADAEDHENLLSQLLTQQRVSPAEFDIVMETNANLRAAVRKQANSDVTDEAIRDEFNQVYGEKVSIRTIPVMNPQETAEVQKALQEPGVRFEEVARRLGRIPTLAQLGGQVQEFTRTSTSFSPVFIEAAFALEEGEVSDPIKSGEFYHIIKLERRIPPTIVKLEDVRDSVRTSLIARREGILMANLRAAHAQRALAELAIHEPTMKAQFEARRDARKTTSEAVRESLEADAPTTLPTTQSATPSPAAATPAPATKAATPAAAATSLPASAAAEVATTRAATAPAR